MRSAYILLLYAILSVGPAFSQTRNELVDTWRVNLDKTFSVMTQREQQHYDSLDSRIKGRLQERFSKRTFMLNNDGTVRVTVSAPDATTREWAGKWSYRENDNVLFITVEGNEDQYKVRKKSTDDILLVYQNPSPKGVFSSLYLTRKK